MWSNGRRHSEVEELAKGGIVLLDMRTCRWRNREMGRWLSDRHKEEMTDRGRDERKWTGV